MSQCWTRRLLGEGCLAGQSIRIATATAITPTTTLVIEKNEMIRVLHAEHAFSDRFISFMLSRNIRVEADLVDQRYLSEDRRQAPPVGKTRASETAEAESSTTSSSVSGRLATVFRTTSSNTCGASGLVSDAFASFLIASGM